MGLKTTNYEVKSMGLVLDNAYAQIGHLSVDLDGKCMAMVKVQTSRENMSKNEIERIHIMIDVDKSVPIHEQIYKAAKDKYFPNWEDDIVDIAEAKTDE